MTETREMKLGGRAFAVPPLPLGTTREVFPLCRKLSLSGGLTDRVMADGLMAALTDEDLADLSAIGAACAKVADPAVTREAFDALPITPPELFDAFLVARYQTGMWQPVVADAGEAPGEASPPTSTLTGSSPA